MKIINQFLACLLITAYIIAPASNFAQETTFTTDESSHAVQAALLAAARNALKQNDTESAVFYYKRYVGQKPDDRPVALELAGVLSQAGRFEETLEICDGVLKTHPSDPEALKLKAVALGRLNRPQDALRTIRELRARLPDDTELQRMEAGLLAMQGDRDFARDFYRDLMLVGFNNVRDWQDYLQLLAADRQWDLLLEAYDKHADRLTVNDAIRFTVLQARIARNDINSAIEVHSAISDPAVKRDSAVMIADRLAAAGRLADAVQFLMPASIPDDPDPDMSAKIALLKAYDKRPVGALALIESVPREKHNTRLLITRVKIFWAAGRPGDALAELNRLGLPANDVDATLTRAGLLYDLHREWEIPALLAVISSSLPPAGTDRRLAWCLTILSYIRTGDWNAARELIAIYADREPEDLAPDILAVMNEKAARRSAARREAEARLGTRLRDYRPGAELIRPALIAEVPAAAWWIAWNTRPSNYFALMELARSCEREGLVKNAEELYETAAANPEFAADSLLGMASCAVRARNSSRVKTIAERLRATPLRFDQCVRAAEIMLRSNENGLAEYFLSRLEPADTRQLDALAARAAWLIRGNRSTEARLLLSSIEPKGPVELGALTYLCRALAELAQSPADPVYEIAIERLLNTAQLDAPFGPADGAIAAADTLMKHNEHDRAHELLVRFERSRPEDLRILDRLMTSNIRLGNYQEAESCARRILARRPGDAERRGLMARMCVWQSDYSQAWRRYRDLIADYPEDELFPLEFAAKQSRAVGNLRRAAPLYSEYAARQTTDREMVVEEGDVWLEGDFTRAAETRYGSAALAFPDDAELRQALDTAERRSGWGLFAEAEYLKRRGNDRKVDVRQDRFEGGARLPRGPDGLTLQAGVGTTEFRFDDSRATPLQARLLAADGRWIFTNGLDLAASCEFLDFSEIKSNWRADLEAGYRGLDGWKAALIAGRHDLRENYYTMRDGLQADSIGAYGQWRPAERLEFFAQYRFMSIDAPQTNALIPTNSFTRMAPVSATSTNTAPVVTPTTWEKNSAHEGVAEVSFHLSFFPHSLRLWLNGYVYATEKENDMYWTPDDPFLAGQVGIHWRHSPGRRHFTGAPTFFYGAYAAVGHNTEGDSSPTLKGELGWQDFYGWGIGIEGGHVWGNEYEESNASARIEYRF